MSSEATYSAALGALRGILARVGNDGELKNIIAAKDEVLARFGPIFSADNIAKLTEEDFKSFLLFKNNKHWTGLHRLGGVICSDMARLRAGLAILLDETRPLGDRLNTLVPKAGPPYVKRLGKAVLTAILQVAHPDSYGVYNGTSESGMAKLGLWPDFDRHASLRDRYMTINEILGKLARHLGIDLWTLDSLWWRVSRSTSGGSENGRDDKEPNGDDSYRFGLERHLHNFMLDNWQHLPLSRQWEIYEEDGETAGYEYDTKEIGRIDLLAHHKTDAKWLVLELKRNQTCDDTVGQVLRYMGWVATNLAESNDTVEGLIIAHETDPRLRYALLRIQDVKLMLYKVDFELRLSEE